jgi:hypothetical protein
MARYSLFELTLQYAFLSSSDQTDAREGAMQCTRKQNSTVGVTDFGQFFLIRANDSSAV